MTTSKPLAANESALYDEFLVVLVQSGDRSAAERLAKRWLPRLAGAAHRLVGPDRAEDAAQDTMVAVISGVRSLRDPSRFAAWAFGILRRRCASIHRTTPPPAEALDEAAIPSRADHSLDRIAIAQAMAALPPDQRFAAHLYFLEGLALAEIAEAQGVPLGTAKSRLFHARRQLKAALSGDQP